MTKEKTPDTIETGVFILRAIYHFLVDTVQTLLLAASIFLVIYVFLYRPFQVSGRSMFSTFYDKEYVLTDLISYRFQEPLKGDVIVFQAPVDVDKDFIKRIIGRPGDSVALRLGDVYVNNTKLNESSYLDSSVKTYGGRFLQDGQTVVVPKDSYFVMGDNRPYSSDSREWGFLDRAKIIGKSFFVYFPLNRMRKVINPFTTTKQ